MSVEHDFMIKYGLRNQPSEYQVRDWSNRVYNYVKNKQISPENAGELVAKEIFPDFNTIFRRSQSQSVEYLFEAILRK